mgnify:FL=1
MLRFLLRYLLLPLVLIASIGYAAIPLWVPTALAFYVQPMNWQGLELKVGYPSHKSWHIDDLSWYQTQPTLAYQADLTHLELNYSWQSLKAQQWPTMVIETAHIELEADTNSHNQVPALALIPSQWLPLWPQFSINKLVFNTSNSQKQVQLAGNLSHQDAGLKLLARISNESQIDTYIDATLGHNDQVEAKLFIQQSTSPVAKITSSVKRQGKQYSWQGQAAINLPFSQTLLGRWWPSALGELTINTGRLTSHWQLNLPIDSYETANLSHISRSAKGELQSQIQFQASSPMAKELDLDASFTHILSASSDPQWRLNEGSQLRIMPNWNNTNIDPNLYQSLLLQQAKLTLNADSPVAITFVEATGLLAATPAIELNGNINATLENTHSVYQLFGQLSQLKLQSLGQWQGNANLSGYYLAQADENPWMTQLPIDLRQLQLLSEVDFSFDPKQWQFIMQPHSKVSATQVESRRQAGSIQLFASDKLNLSNGKPLTLTYQPQQDYWTWSDIDLQLKPESIPSQGLTVNVSEGSSLLNNRPTQGHFDLQPTAIKIANWPALHAVSQGDFNWLEGQLTVNFEAQLPPYVSAVDGQYTWQANAYSHQLVAQAKTIELAPLLPQLSSINALLPLPLPLTLGVTSGTIDYRGDWQWGADQTQALQRIDYDAVSGRHNGIQVTGVGGHSLFEFDSNKADDLSVQGQHSLRAKTLAWGPTANLKMLQPHIELTSTGWTGQNYQIEKFDAQWLGGRLLASNNTIKHQSLNTLHMSLQNQQLNQLLSLAKSPDLSATGKVSGNLTMHLDLRSNASQAWTLAQGDLVSSQMGLLSLAPADAAETDPKTAYLHDILSHFNYQQLTAKLSRNQDQGLSLTTHLVGSNPNFKDGHAVDFNLTLNPELLLSND